MSDSGNGVDDGFGQALATVMAEGHLSTADVADSADVRMEDVRAAIGRGSSKAGQHLTRLMMWLDARQADRDDVPSGGDREGHRS